MGQALVIVESPAKAKTINQYLGSNFIVKSSIGHIRDLPSSQSTKQSAAATKRSVATKNAKADPVITAQVKKQQALVNRMGVDPYQGWQARYEIIPGKEKVIAELKALAKQVDEIYLATDLDREGEAIAWHLQEAIGGNQQRYRRVIFNEITREAIRQAFAHPGTLDLARVQAQQARRFLDRVVGYMVSPLLWKKIARGLSAGRVQSVAVRLVVERERAIKAFLPEEYWELRAQLEATSGESLCMQVVQQQGEPFKPKNEAAVQAAIAQLQPSDYQLISREVKLTTSKPPAPFITSTLQQAASTRIGFNVRKTMIAAQRLYEAGYITYMRTDSTNLSSDAVDKVREHIQQVFGDRYLPANPNRYKSKHSAQEAHEAIRPTKVDQLAEQLKNVDADARKLYQLIWAQFVACQMVPAEYQSTTLIAQAGDFLLKTKGVVLQFDGWTRVLPVSRKGDEQQLLPNLQVPSVLQLKKLDPSQHFTKAPARYGEASLVKELEKRGIGRPSTYASIISTIQERGYVRSDNKRFYAEKMGEIVTERLLRNFQGLMSYDFTAQMETILDEIAAKKMDWQAALDSFFADFNQQLTIAEKEEGEGGMPQNSLVLTEISCPRCQQPMGIRTASTGVFLGCSSYANASPTERCKQTINLVPENEILNLLADDAVAETTALRNRRRCLLCSTAMDSYWMGSKHRLYICGDNPNCSGYLLEEASNGRRAAIVCEKCNSEMLLKTGRFGKYMGCSNSDCGNTRKILRNGELAPPKEEPILLSELKCSQSSAYFVLRQGAAGLFLAANTFPKDRESRAPFVEELVRFKGRLPEKLHYLTEAPTLDPQGNRTVVRFSRKTKQHYIAAENSASGKNSRWALFYQQGQWQLREGK
ncbi:MAG: type I DNA topoisomerase [Candidatus Symbiodolus clandestinus]